MKVEYEWQAGDERGRLETITKNESHKPWPWWCWALIILLGGAIGAVLIYSGYAAFA